MPAFDAENLKVLQAEMPSWRADQMEAAFRVFQGLEEPTGAEEDWRYVDFDLAFSDLVPALEPGDGLEPDPFLKSLGARSGHVVVVDGHVIAIDGDGAVLRRLGDVEERVSLVPVDHNKLAAAHTAFAVDGVFVDVPDAAVIDEPVVVEVQAVSEGTATFPHVAVRVGRNAQAKVLLVYRSAAGARLLTVPEVSLEVAEGGNLRFLSVQSLDHAGSIVVHQRVRLDRDASVRLGEVGLGADLGRLDLGVSLEGDGSSSNLVGLYFGEGSQTLDYRLVVNHRGRNTTSDIFLKGALEDAAQSVFTGLLRIEKDAQKTSTFETNRNLVLSENAKAHSVPNLEILCNDVVCGHASSVGPLEEEHLYYLQSRGLRRERAERLLVRGFFAEVVERLPIEGIAEPVSDEVFRRFTQAQEEGRLR